MSSLLRLQRSLSTSAVRLYPALPTYPVYSPDEAGPSEPARRRGRPRKVVDPNEPAPRPVGRPRKTIDPNEPTKIARPVGRPRLASAVATDKVSGAASTSASTEGDNDGAAYTASMPSRAATTATSVVNIDDTGGAVINSRSEAPPSPRRYAPTPGADRWRGPFSEERGEFDLLSVALAQREDNKLRRKALRMTEFYEQGKRPEGVAAPRQPPRPPRPPRQESTPKPLPLPPKKEFVSRKAFMSYDDFLPPSPSRDTEEGAPLTASDSPNPVAPDPVAVTNAVQRPAHGLDDTKLSSDSTHDTVVSYSKDHNAMKEAKITTPTIPGSLWDDIGPLAPQQPEVSNEEFETAFKKLEGRILSGDGHEPSDSSVDDLPESGQSGLFPDAPEPPERAPTPPPRFASREFAPAVRASPPVKRPKSMIVPSWMKVLKDSFPTKGGARRPAPAASATEDNSPRLITAKSSAASSTVDVSQVVSELPVASESAPSASAEAASDKRFVWPKSGTAKPVGKKPNEYSLSWHNLDLSNLPAKDRRIVFTTADQLDEFNQAPRGTVQATRPGVMSVRAYPRRAMSHGGLSDLLAPTQVERDAQAAAIAAYHASKRKVLPKLPLAGTYIKHIDPSTKVVLLSIRATKTKISNKSAERRAARTAARGALDLVANRTDTPISTDYAYLCTVGPDIFRTPMVKLCGLAEDIMREVHRKLVSFEKEWIRGGGSGNGGPTGGRPGGAMAHSPRSGKPDMRNAPKPRDHKGKRARVSAS